MKNNREAGNLFLDFSEDIEAKVWGNENTVRIARALLWLELECAVARADRDGERVNACLLDELLNLFRLRVGSLVCGNLYIVLDAGELTELCLDDDAMLMRISDNLLRALDVFLECIVRAIEHDGSEASIDAGLARLEVWTMIEVQRDGDIVDFESSLYEMHEISMLCILACACGALQDDWGVQLSGCLRDALHDFHVVDIESTDCIFAFVCLLEHFLSSD